MLQPLLSKSRKQINAPGMLPGRESSRFFLYLSLASRSLTSSCCHKCHGAQGQPHPTVTSHRAETKLSVHSSWTLDSDFLWFTNADMRIQLPQPALPGPQMAPQLCVFHAGLVLVFTLLWKNALEMPTFPFFKNWSCIYSVHTCAQFYPTESYPLLSCGLQQCFYTVSPKAHNHVKR